MSRILERKGVELPLTAAFAPSQRSSWFRIGTLPLYSMGERAFSMSEAGRLFVRLTELPVVNRYAPIWRNGPDA